MPSMDRNANDATRLRRNAQRQRAGDGSKDIKATAPIGTSTGSITLTTDGSTLAVVGGALGVKAGGVGTSQLANNGVTLAKLGALTTKGDLLVYDTGHNRLPVGSDSYVLKADSTQAAGVKWAEGQRDFIKRLRQAVNLNADEATAATAPTFSVPQSVSFSVLGGTYQPIISGGAIVTNLYHVEKASLAINANPNYVGRSNITSSSTSSAFEISCLFDGSQIEFGYKAANLVVQYLVNDQLVGPVQTAFGVGGNWTQTLTFASRATRKITIRGANDFFFAFARGGSNTDTIWQPQVPNKLRAIALGDSFTEPTIQDVGGVGGTNNYGFNGWADALGRLTGWEVWPSGSGGTGYTTNGGIGGRFTFRGRFASDVAAYNPDILVLAGGLNDRAGWVSNPATLTTELATFAPVIKAVSSLKLVVVLGPFRAQGQQSDTSLNGISSALQSWAATNSTVALPWLFVDVNWLTGSGTVSALANNGNSDYYVGTDTVHPSTLGQAYHGQRLAMEIIRQLA